MQQRRYRRGRDHRVRKPEVERHQRRLADAEDEEQQQRARHNGRDLSGGQQAAIDKIETLARHEPGPHDGGEQEADGRAEQREQVDARAALGRRVALVRHQRIGRERQDFVEDEQREQVARHRDAHRAAEGDGEADVEARLVALAVPAHVADGVERVDDPQAAGDHGEQGAERLQLERKGEARNRFTDVQLRPRAGGDQQRQLDDDGEQRNRAGDRDAFAQVRKLAEGRNTGGNDQRQADGGGDQEFGRHLYASSPSAATAPSRARLIGKVASMP